MRTRTKAATGLLSAIGLVFSSGVAAHDSGNDGHVPANVNYGFEVIGRDTLGGVEDGLYTDVWSHDGYAYVGTFQDPGCTDAGVFITDIAAAIDQYAADGSTSGATVATIKSAPNTRINDVKVHQVGDVDVLITTQEPCGRAIPGAAQPGSNAPGQVGQGGISLYDVSNPAKPKALKKNFMEYEGVHNTFAWDHNGRSYLIGTADTFDFFDTFFVDITKPQSPKVLSITGALDWLAVGAFADGQFETGSSAGIFNHDVWVENIDGVPTAVVSYWDAGFVTLDVSDPANPVFLGDSTYPETNINGQPYEGNAHAAVFGGNGDYIFAGDEDFSPDSFGLQYGDAEYPAGIALWNSNSGDLAGSVVYPNPGEDGCTSVAPATGPNQIALIDRGGCFFSQKGYNAEVAGYAGFIVVNNAGDGLLNMSPGDEPLPEIPGVFIGQSDGDAIKANLGESITASSIFDGWGYLHVLNNTGGDLTVPAESPGATPTTDVANLGHIGYYAPAEAVEAGLGTEFGDLTMHNLEVDPATQDVTPTFDAGPRMFVSWYALGMRALEYRPGHYHDNSNGEGSYSWNVHEVGRWIEPDGGSNFWGVHVDEIDGQQVILASDRNNGLYVFTFGCEDEVEGPFYCQLGTDGGG